MVLPLESECSLMWMRVRVRVMRVRYGPSVPKVRRTSRSLFGRRDVRTYFFREDDPFDALDDWESFAGNSTSSIPNTLRSSLLASSRTAKNARE